MASDREQDSCRPRFLVVVSLRDLVEAKGKQVCFFSAIVPNYFHATR